MLAAIGEFELDLIRERTRAGLRAARKRGQRLGRPKLHVDRAKLRRGAQSGYSISALSRHFDVSRFVVRRELAEMGLSVKVAGSGPVTARKAGVPASV